MSALLPVNLLSGSSFFLSTKPGNAHTTPARAQNGRIRPSKALQKAIKPYLDGADSVILLPPFKLGRCGGKPRIMRLLYPDTANDGLNSHRA